MSSSSPPLKNGGPIEASNARAFRWRWSAVSAVEERRPHWSGSGPALAGRKPSVRPSMTGGPILERSRTSVAEYLDELRARFGSEGVELWSCSMACVGHERPLLHQPGRSKRGRGPKDSQKFLQL